ncbi:MAG: iron-sulfur cluster insertion protein ErpA [Brevundimonas sp.]|uniref:iron-sulfur cluster insertion protein ErpA n=1 Tax=Brevundimonas sp. TaxID=1871086 RepID=UPI004033B405
MSTVQSSPAFELSPSTGGHGLTLADSAARRLAKLGEAEGHPVMLRVAVDGGGCSGFQYRLELVEAADAEDIVIRADGQAAVVDPVSLPFLKGSEIAFVDDLSGAQFVVRNPNAASSCGCGVSFSI